MSNAVMGKALHYRYKSGVDSKIWIEVHRQDLPPHINTVKEILDFIKQDPLSGYFIELIDEVKKT